MLLSSSPKVKLIKLCCTLSIVSILLRQISILASLTSSTEHLTTCHRIPIQFHLAFYQKMFRSFFSALCRIKMSTPITPQVLFKHFQSWAVSSQFSRSASSSITYTRNGLTRKSTGELHKIKSLKKMKVWQLRKLDLCIQLKTLTNSLRE